MADMLNDGNIRLTFAPSVANISAPTVDELGAGVDLECLVTAGGFQPTVDEEVVQVAKLCETSNSEAPGRATHQITLTLVRQVEEDEDIAWNTLHRGTAGFLVVRYGVDHSTPWQAGDRVVVYPVTCGERRQMAPEANGATQFQSQMYVTSQPDLDAVVAGSDPLG